MSPRTLKCDTLLKKLSVYHSESKLFSAVKACFANAHRVIDRFHVQHLAFDAVQEIRIKHRWEALEQENQEYEQAKRAAVKYEPARLSNGDTAKQLLARSRYLLFKHPRLWTREQQQKAELLFSHYPLIHKSYQLSLRLGEVYSEVKIGSGFIFQGKLVIKFTY
ncbi:transposase [Chitinophaga polysaccharea]|uniref:transposase n=1 Tax=Chitinophaga polysaccharea TaxID=1293035 RepID=UPI0011A336DC|nr:transposase [Chitinophaga polysaccharea]